nr:PREDICTED: glucose dehydrogenase [FAD, quinone]-like [Bemisia tabaci]
MDLYGKLLRILCIWVLYQRIHVLAIPLTFFTAVLRLYVEKGLLAKEESFVREELLDREYDFIVVGGGTTGNVVGARLSENPDWTVLVLEAGYEQTFFTEIPLVNTFLILTEYNWKYRAQPQEGMCLGLEGGVCPWPAGKGIGGTSNINAMIWTRGNRRDYDNWAAQGNPGWSYSEVLPYFLKSENYTIPELEDSPWHSNKGPIEVGYAPYRTQMLNAFLEAGKELGFQLVDYNNPNTHVGFSAIQASQGHGRRSYSKEYLKNAHWRSNLFVLQLSLVTKILLNRDKIAYGVRAEIRGKQVTFRARKEVILCAGAFNSPKLLMLSGIGPRDHLEELGIKVITELPGVGQNLQEHTSMAGLTFLVNSTKGITTSLLVDTIPDTFTEWYLHGTGILTLMGCEGLAYVKTKYDEFPDEDVPDIEFIFVPASLGSDKGLDLRKGMGVTDQIYNSVYKPVEDRDAWSIWPMILYPKSRGEVRLADRNPHSAPLLYARFGTDRRDLDVIVEGIKLAIGLSATKAFQALGSELVTIPIPGCETMPFGADEYWECAARTITTQLHHQCGTCKMGPATDPTAVVDAQLRVYGVHNLRVADASIIPTLPAAHTQAPCYMIGEKVADMIKEEWMPEYVPEHLRYLNIKQFAVPENEVPVQ